MLCNMIGGEGGLENIAESLMAAGCQVGKGQNQQKIFVSFFFCGRKKRIDLETLGRTADFFVLLIFIFLFAVARKHPSFFLIIIYD